MATDKPCAERDGPFYPELDFIEDIQYWLRMSQWDHLQARSYFASKYPPDELDWRESRLRAAMKCLMNDAGQFKAYIRTEGGGRRIDPALIEGLWRYFYAASSERVVNVDFELIRLLAHECKRKHSRQ